MYVHAHVCACLYIILRGLNFLKNIMFVYFKEMIINNDAY